MKTVSTTLSNEQPNTYNIYVKPNDVINSLSGKTKQLEKEVKQLLKQLKYYKWYSFLVSIGFWYLVFKLFLFT